MTSPIPVTQIPRLLFDATVTACDWNPRSHRLALAIRCLRADSNHQNITLPVVLVLTGVKALAITTDQVDPHIQPSKASIPRPTSIARLPKTHMHLVWGSGVTFHNKKSLAWLLSAAHVEWLAGDSKTLLRSRQQVVVGEFAPRAGLHRLKSMSNILVGASEIHIESDGKPLSLADWRKQYANWWRNPKDLDDSTDASNAASLPPAKAARFDRGGPPTSDPVFDVGETDLPPELLGLARRMLERRYSSGLSRRDQPPDRNWFESCQFARSVEAWWQEGRRGYIRLRGIQFDPADHESPAQLIEAVWELSLLRNDRGWSVRQWLQTYPAYGNAPTLPLSKKPWLRDWRGGPVRIRRNGWFLAQ